MIMTLSWDLSKSTVDTISFLGPDPLPASVRCCSRRQAMASVIQLVETDAQIPGAGSVSIRGADEARNTFALKKTSRAARILSPQSIWDENSLLQILRDDGIKDMHAWNIWKYLIRTPNIDISQVRLEVRNSDLMSCAHAPMPKLQATPIAFRISPGFLDVFQTCFEGSLCHSRRAW